MAKTPQIPVFHIYHNKDIALYRATVREDKVYCRDEKIAEFENSAVFTITDELGRRKRKFKAVLYLDGKANACAIQTGKEIKNKIQTENPAQTINLEKLQSLPDNIETIFEPLTFKDRITIVKREIAKQLGKFKPMETWQFVVLIALVSASIVVNFIF